jgi:hypothetical protein
VDRAYLPYIAAGIVGEKLDFPQLFLLMRLFGLVAFTAAVAYAIWVIPVLKWSFVIVAPTSRSAAVHLP